MSVDNSLKVRVSCVLSRDLTSLRIKSEIKANPWALSHPPDRDQHNLWSTAWANPINTIWRPVAMATQSTAGQGAVHACVSVPRKCSLGRNSMKTMSWLNLTQGRKSIQTFRSGVLHLCWVSLAAPSPLYVGGPWSGAFFKYTQRDLREITIRYVCVVCIVLTWLVGQSHLLDRIKELRELCDIICGKYISWNFLRNQINKYNHMCLCRTYINNSLAWFEIYLFF